MRPTPAATHLPDVTVVMPVFLDSNTPEFFVAARGHHADIGGITPGSMPADSKTIGEEGVLLDNVHVVEQGVFLDDALRTQLTSGAYPVRNVTQNLADLRAQVSACQKGQRGIDGHDGALRPRRGARLHAATCRTTPKPRCAR